MLRIEWSPTTFTYPRQWHLMDTVEGYTEAYSALRGLVEGNMSGWVGYRIREDDTILQHVLIEAPGNIIWSDNPTLIKV
jgi:hypothetical protein